MFLLCVVFRCAPVCWVVLGYVLLRCAAPRAAMKRCARCYDRLYCRVLCQVVPRCVLFCNAAVLCRDLVVLMRDGCVVWRLGLECAVFVEVLFLFCIVPLWCHVMCDVGSCRPELILL